MNFILELGIPIVFAATIGFFISWMGTLKMPEKSHRGRTRNGGKTTKSPSN